MKDVKIMEGFQSFSDLDKNSPDLLFVKVAFFLFVLCDFLVEIAAVGKFHDNALLCGGNTINFFPRGKLPCRRQQRDFE